jgi:hypothetical protein
MRNARRVFATLVASAMIVGALGSVAGAKKVKPKPKPAASPNLIVTVSPNPLVEAGISEVQAIIQVEAKANFAGSTVTISSVQLSANCKSGILFGSLFNTTVSTPNSITLALDNNGNATVTLDGPSDCSPGTDLIEASLNAPPFSTAVTKLVVVPPQVTPPGVRGFPANEVETGDGTQGPLSASDVNTVFYVETNPVFAEQTTQISSNELLSRCGMGITWFSNLGTSVTATATATLDNDGNAVFTFQGASCAAGKSTVIAEIFANGPTYSSQYNILPPQVTI